MEADAYIFLLFFMFYTYKISKSFKSRTFPELGHWVVCMGTLVFPLIQEILFFYHFCTTNGLT